MSASNDSSFKRRPSNACIATDVTSGGGSFNSRLSRGPTGEGGERMVRSERWSDGDLDEFEAAVELQKVKRRSLDGTSSKTQAESKVVRHLAERRVSDFNEASAASAGATARARRENRASILEGKLSILDSTLRSTMWRRRSSAMSQLAESRRASALGGGNEGGDRRRSSVLTDLIGSLSPWSPSSPPRVAPPAQQPRSAAGVTPPASSPQGEEAAKARGNGQGAKDKKGGMLSRVRANLVPGGVGGGRGRRS